MSATYTADEMMTVAAARMLCNGAVCFVGIGLPSTAANLARLTHAPDAVLVYESGPIGAKPSVLPLSIGDGNLAETADTVVSTPEIFRYWLQGGRIDIGFLGAAQLDRFANINTTVVGPYEKPKVRLPGAGGAPEISSSAKEVLIIVKQSKRTFVEKLDFVTSVGFLTGGDVREKLGIPGRGPVAVITDLCILRPDPVSRELKVAKVHPGVDRETIAASTSWPVKFDEACGYTEVPTADELRVLRDLKTRTLAAHGVQGDGS
jgi:glutaconate CoA-transferase, subunit B